MMGWHERVRPQFVVTQNASTTATIAVTTIHVDQRDTERGGGGGSNGNL
jgi:hypothetical protein